MTAADKNEMAKTNPFKDLNLISLRQHACPKANKTNEWYLKCIDCPDNHTCGVGRRVNEIMENMTKPDESQITKFENRVKKKEKLDIEARFREAVRHDDPLKWLVEQGYYVSRHTAYNNYAIFRKKHPEMPSLSARTRDCLVNAGKEGGQKRIDTVKITIRSLFADCPKDKMLERYLERGIGRDRSIVSAYTKLRDWCNKYPDLEQEIGYGSIRPILRDMWRDYNGKSVGEVLEMLEKEKKPEEDEISLEDFLKENGTETNFAEKPEADEILSDREVKKILLTDFSNDPTSKSADQMTLQRVFGKKRQDLKARIEREKKNMADIQAEIERLKGQLKTLDDAAALFGMVPVINCGDKKEATA